MRTCNNVRVPCTMRSPKGDKQFTSIEAEGHVLTAMRAMVKAAELMSSRTASANASAYSCVKAVPTPCDCPAWRQDSASGQKMTILLHETWLRIEPLVEQCRAQTIKTGADKSAFMINRAPNTRI